MGGRGDGLTRIGTAISSTSVGRGRGSCRRGQQIAPFCARRRPRRNAGSPSQKLPLLWSCHLVPTFCRDRLPRCHRASPSTALDKLGSVYRSFTSLPSGVSPADHSAPVSPTARQAAGSSLPPPPGHG